MLKEYDNHLKEKETYWENLCKHCGGCCGSFDAPCLNLVKDYTGKFSCKIYSMRFGPQETISGDKFHCVPIKEIIDTYWKNDYLCAYKQYLKSPWVTISK